MSSHSDGPNGPKKSRRKRRRKPHNARVPRHQALTDIVEAIGAEPRTLPSADGDVSMSRKERIYRLMIHRALSGEVHDLAHLLRLMVKYPNIAVGRGETHYFMSRLLWRA